MTRIGRSPRRRFRSGQSMLEIGGVMPILLLRIVADFGRTFSAGLKSALGSTRATGETLTSGPSGSRRLRIARDRATSGQSTVEFVLIAPLLLVLLVAIADFGRVFAAGLVVEAAARNAAEVVSEDYLRNPPGDPLLSPAQRLAAPAPASGFQSYYDDLALKAARTVCVEMRSLPNTTFDSSDGSCPTWPVVRVCIHDQTTNTGNNHCGQPITPGFDASPPGECDQLPPPGDPTWDPSMMGGGAGPGGEPSRYVEVRVCYPFTTFFNLPAVPNRIVFQRTRMFTIACFQDPSSAGNNGSC